MYYLKKILVATVNVMRMNFGCMSVKVETLILRVTLKSISIESAASLS